MKCSTAKQFQSNATLPKTVFMMTSSNGNIFRVTNPLCGEFPGPRSPVNSPHKGQWRGALMFSLIWVWINDWVNTREAGDLRPYHAHYDVIVMWVVYSVMYSIIVYVDLMQLHLMIETPNCHGLSWGVCDYHSHFWTWVACVYFPC